MPEYSNEVMTAIRQVMDIESHFTITPETELINDLGFDSGLYLDLNLQLEDVIPGLRMDPSQMRAEDFETVGSITRFVGVCMKESLQGAES